MTNHNNNESQIQDRFSWQLKGLNKYLKHPSQFFLVNACTGSGKTTFASKCIEKELARGGAEQVLIMAPNEDVCKSFKEKCWEYGIEVTTEWNRGMTAAQLRQFDGAVMTYSMMNENREALKKIVRGRKTIAVCDEFHHLEETKAFGIAALDIFGNVAKWIGLTGTAFRSLGIMPRVKYDKDGFSMADLMYAYWQALADKVCRYVSFLHTDGKTTWEYKGQIKTYTTLQMNDEIEAAKALRTALTTPGVPTKLLRDGLLHTNKFRLTDPKAAMIVFAIDISHAKWLVGLLRDLGEEDVVLVVSEDPKAYKKLAEFKESSRKVIVSVGMVSEGVDIKRLRVGVYLTVVESLLYWLQCLGRVLRFQNKGDREARWLQPQSSFLETCADKMLEEKKVALKVIEERKNSELAGNFGERSFSLLKPIGSEPVTGTIIMPDTKRIQYLPSDEAELYESVCQRLKSDLAPAVFAEMLNAGMINDQHIQSIPEQRKHPDTETKELRTELNKLIRKIREMQWGKDDVLVDKHFAQLWNACNRHIGVKEINEASVLQLRSAVEWATRKLLGVSNDR